MDETCRARRCAILFPRHIGVVVLGQTVIECCIFLGKIERHGLIARSSQPGFDGIIVAIPILAHAEPRLRCVVVDSHIFSFETFHKVVAPTVVAHLPLHPVEISLYIVLHISRSVVEISRATPVFSRIVSTSSHAMGGAEGGCSSLGIDLIVATDVGQRELVRAIRTKVVGREVGPIGITGTMVDDDVGNDSYAFVMEGRD